MECGRRRPLRPTLGCGRRRSLRPNGIRRWCWSRRSALAAPRMFTLLLRSVVDGLRVAAPLATGERPQERRARLRDGRRRVDGELKGGLRSAGLHHAGSAQIEMTSP